MKTSVTKATPAAKKNSTHQPPVPRIEARHLSAGKSAIHINQQPAGGIASPGSPAPLQTQAAKNVPRGIQAKLRIGEQDNEMEHEADAVAKKVMSGSAAAPADDGSSENHGRGRTGHPAFPRSQTHAGPRTAARKVEIRRHAASNPADMGSGAVDGSLETRINGLRGGGAPLPESEKQFFESNMGYDFSKVRIHANANAAAISRDMNAKAWTLGNDVAFAEGQYQPGTTEGRTLLAHELTHVVQQTGAGPAGESSMAQASRANVIQRAPGDEEASENRELTTSQEVLRTIIDIAVLPLLANPASPLGLTILALRARGLQPVGLGVGLFLGGDVGIPLGLPAGPGVGGEISVAALISLDNLSEPKITPFESGRIGVSTPKASVAAGLVLALLFAPRDERLDPVEAFGGVAIFGSVGAGIGLGADIGGSFNLSLLNGRAGAIHITLGLSLGPESPLDASGGLANTQELAARFKIQTNELRDFQETFLEENANWQNQVLRARQDPKGWSLSVRMPVQVRNALNFLGEMIFASTEPENLAAFSQAVETPIGNLSRIPTEATFVFLEDSFRALAQQGILKLPQGGAASPTDHLFFIRRAKPRQLVDAMRIGGVMKFKGDICRNALEMARRNGEQVPSAFVRAGIDCNAPQTFFDDDQ